MWGYDRALTARQLAYLYVHCLVTLGVRYSACSSSATKQCTDKHPFRLGLQAHASKCAKLSRQTGLGPLGSCLPTQRYTPIWQHTLGSPGICIDPWGPGFGAFVSLCCAVTGTLPAAANLQADC